MSIRLEVWGDYALFTRPEFKAERVSYEVMTPSAACGLLECIYWHPGVRYVIDRIHVCNPIRYFNIRRNERSAIASARKARTAIEQDNCELARPVSDSIVQRGNTVLRDVRYIIEAHIEKTEDAGEEDSIAKYYAIFERRAERGQCFKQPSFGIREYVAHFRLCKEIPPCPEELCGTKALGQMLHHLNYSNPENVLAVFFDAVLVDGVLNIPADPSITQISYAGERRPASEKKDSEGEVSSASAPGLKSDPYSGSEPIIKKVGNRILTLRLLSRKERKK